MACESALGAGQPEYLRTPAIGMRTDNGVVVSGDVDWLELTTTHVATLGKETCTATHFLPSGRPSPSRELLLLHDGGETASLDARAYMIMRSP